MLADAAEVLFSRVGAGIDDLLVVETGASVVGWLVLEAATPPLRLALEDVEAPPSRSTCGESGRGAGTALLREAERFAREELGLLGFLCDRARRDRDRCALPPGRLIRRSVECLARCG